MTERSAGRRILFVTNTIPGEEIGATKRAAAHLQALCSLGDVDLVLIGGHDEASLPGDLRRQFGTVVVEPVREEAARWKAYGAMSGRLAKTKALLFDLFPPELHSLSDPEAEASAARLPACRYDVVFAFKIQAISWVHQVLASKAAPTIPVRIGDFDDLTSDYRAKLGAQAGHGSLMRLIDQVHVARIRRVERQVLKSWDLTIVCSETDSDRAMALGVAHREPLVVPNGVTMAPPCEPTGVWPADRPIRLLFIGLLNYKPNVDALHWLANDILPALDEQMPRPFVVDVVGRRDTGEVEGLCRQHPALNFLGEADSLQPVYESAAAAIVPLRLGSGTRLKILEAFQFGRAVISTHKGAEGLSVTDGEHILLADTAGKFAAAVRRIAEDDALRAALETAGRERLLALYTREAIVAEQVKALGSLMQKANAI
ncbi:MAG: glycosyltransferase family 4 protein [Pacificimonas sp.]|jgi:glycosyltransferase involved in cell wall biosynthesis|nr:glycosyltransferase family 4 protein [Pacificimonas sp.]